MKQYFRKYQKLFRKHRERNGSLVLNCLKPYLGRCAQALDIHCPGDLAIDLVSERKKRDGR